MDREIKFRALKLRPEELNEEQEFVYRYKFSSVWYGKNGIWRGEIQDNAFTQFSGLKDKDGMDIYEGDIVAEMYNEEMHGEVVFQDCCFGYILRGMETHCNYGKFNRMHTVVVIGNIYQTPELIK